MQARLMCSICYDVSFFTNLGVSVRGFYLLIYSITLRTVAFSLLEIKDGKQVCKS